MGVLGSIGATFLAAWRSGETPVSYYLGIPYHLLSSLHSVFLTKCLELVTFPSAPLYSRAVSRNTFMHSKVTIMRQDGTSWRYVSCIQEKQTSQISISQPHLLLPKITMKKNNNVRTLETQPDGMLWICHLSMGTESFLASISAWAEDMISWLGASGHFCNIAIFTTVDNNNNDVLN